MNMKSLKKWITVALSISLLRACALALQKAEALEQSDDMRAVRISTVYSADYPSVQNDMEKQKQEFITKLDEIKNMGLNTVVVQVRPKSDAFYTSQINPWSEILTNTILLSLWRMRIISHIRKMRIIGGIPRTGFIWMRSWASFRLARSVTGK